MLELLADIVAIFRYGAAVAVDGYLDFQVWALSKLHICAECGWRRARGEAVCDKCYIRLVDQRVI